MSETVAVKFRAKSIDGRWMYPVSGHVTGAGWNGAYVASADWSDGIDVITGLVRDTAFLVADDTVTELTYRTAPKKELVAWVRGDAAMAAHLPERVLAAEWAEFAVKHGTRASGRYDDDEEYIVEQFYTREYEDIPGETLVHSLTSEYTDLPIDLTDPASFEDIHADWVFEQNPAYMIFGRAYGHALPGTVHGVRERLAEKLNVLPGVTVWTQKLREGVVEGIVNLPYEDGRVQAVKIGRKTVNAKSFKNMPFSFRLPSTIAGTSKADAVTKAETLINEYVTTVKNFGWAACAHCDGEGVVRRDA